MVSKGIAPRDHIKENKTKIKTLQSKAHQTIPCDTQPARKTKNIISHKLKTHQTKSKSKPNIPPLPLHLLDYGIHHHDCAAPRSTKKHEVLEFKTNNNFGKVPQYIINRKRENMEDKRREEEMYYQPPPGARYATDKEKQQAVLTLERNKELIVNILRDLPLVVDTFGLQQKKQFLEQKLDSIESTLALYAQPKVCIPL